MKISFLFSFWSALMVFMFSGVTECLGQGNEWNSIDGKKVTVAGIRLGDPVGQMILRIGKPDTIIAKVNEFEGTEYYDYRYGNSRFSVDDNKIAGFHLSDSSFSFGDSRPIKVGDPYAALRQLFPQSFSSRFKGEDNSVIIKVRIGSTDSYILFVAVAGRITEIMSWDDW